MSQISSVASVHFNLLLNVDKLLFAAHESSSSKTDEQLTGMIRDCFTSDK